jgi:hypothetical protein
MVPKKADFESAPRHNLCSFRIYSFIKPYDPSAHTVTCQEFKGILVPQESRIGVSEEAWLGFTLYKPILGIVRAAILSP